MSLKILDSILDLVLSPDARSFPRVWCSDSNFLVPEANLNYIPHVMGRCYSFHCGLKMNIQVATVD